MKTVYRVDTGEEFSTKEECQKYEAGILPERLVNRRAMVKNRKRYLDQALSRYRGCKKRLLKLMRRRSPASRKNIDALKVAVYATASAGDEYELRLRELAAARKELGSLLGEGGKSDAKA